MNVHETIAAAAETISRRDAETLLLHMLQHDRAWLITHGEEPLSAELVLTLECLTARRASHEPMQYLTGTQEFFGLPLHVTRDTLIPRPETEHLVEAVIAWAQRLPSALRILDVGTGTGAIALALAAHLPGAHITALDISAAALEVARWNAESLGLAARVRWLHSDLLAAVAPELAAGARLDAVVSNPPYVALADAATLQAEVRDHEPHTALFAGDDGLAIYRSLIPAAHTALRPGGLLAMEFGFGQREALAALLSGEPGLWSEVRFVDDYAGIPRVVLAMRV